MSLGISGDAHTDRRNQTLEHPTNTSSAKRRYQCRECDLVLKNKKNLDRHCAVLHGLGRFYQCPHCDRRIRCMSELQQHLKGPHKREMTPEESKHLTPIVNTNSTVDAIPTVVVDPSIPPKSTPCVQQKRILQQDSLMNERRVNTAVHRKSDRKRRRRFSRAGGAIFTL